MQSREIEDSEFLETLRSKISQNETSIFQLKDQLLKQKHAFKSSEIKNRITDLNRDSWVLEKSDTTPHQNINTSNPRKQDLNGDSWLQPNSEKNINLKIHRNKKGERYRNSWTHQLSENSHNQQIFGSLKRRNEATKETWGKVNSQPHYDLKIIRNKRERGQSKESLMQTERDRDIRINSEQRGRSNDSLASLRKDFRNFKNEMRKSVQHGWNSQLQSFTTCKALKNRN